MGHKIFVSYKYGDSSVFPLEGIAEGETTVRNYVDKLEEILKGESHIYKGEEDSEDLSGLKEETIKKHLAEKLFDSTVTIVFISPEMRDTSLQDNDQWIPWEVSYSLKSIARYDSSGNLIHSGNNAMVAVVLPDVNGHYEYSIEPLTCCEGGCILHHNGNLFRILRKNMFNLKNALTGQCKVDGSTVWSGECSYIAKVRWDAFIENPDLYIEGAIERQKSKDDYEIEKEVGNE